MFPPFSNEENPNPDLSQAIKNHLQSLQTVCASYFPDLDTTRHDWICNPFSNTTWQNLDFKLQNAAIELRNDRTLQLKFNDVLVTSFWISLHEEYPKVSVKEVDILFQFSTSWLYGHGFSALVNVKTKKRQEAHGRSIGGQHADLFVQPVTSN